MKKYRDILFYIVTLFGFTGLMYIILRQGQNREHAAATSVSEDEGLWSAYGQNFHHPLAILLLQIITIIIAARLFGYLCKKVKQPTVVGEIAAGIFLGPSVIGTWFP